MTAKPPPKPPFVSTLERELAAREASARAAQDNGSALARLNSHAIGIAIVIAMIATIVAAAGVLRRIILWGWS